MMDIDEDQFDPPPRTHWQKIVNLPKETISILQNLYSSYHISFLMRDFLAEWIESTQSNSIRNGNDAGRYLSLMISEFRNLASNERLSIKLELEKAAKETEDFYKDKPLDFAYNMEILLKKEYSLLNEEKDPQEFQHSIDAYTMQFKDLEKLSMEIQKQLNVPDLNYINDELYSTMDGFKSINENLKEQLRYMYSELKSMSDKIVNEDLQKWTIDQRLYGSDVESHDLITIQERCSQVMLLIDRSRRQIEQINEYGRFCSDLGDYFTQLYWELIKSTFIVSEQPPQIVILNNLMKASVSLLCGQNFSVGLDPQAVKVELISISGEIKGNFQKNSSTMQFRQNQCKAKFEKLKLTTVQRVPTKKGKCVTDEMFQLKFSMNIENGPILEARSVPVVVISNVSQECKATASILWNNHFRFHTFPQIIPQEFPQTVSWTEFTKMLTSKFRKEIGVDLLSSHLEYFASKLFGDQSKMDVSWDQFCKTNMKDKNFTFWEWFWATMKFIQNNVLKLYKNNLIAGFFDKMEAEKVLQNKPEGTFLLRFSENILGSISIVLKGSKCVEHYAPFTEEKLKHISLAKIILDHKKRTRFLYPHQIKVEEFKKYVKTRDKSLKDLGYRKINMKIKIGSDSDEDENDEGRNNDLFCSSFSSDAMMIYPELQENIFSD